MPTADAQHVTAKTAADMTGHSERTIRRWLASGKLHARKTQRGDWQIAVEDLPAPARHAETVEDLRRTVEDLRRRVALLERQVRTPVAPVTRSQAADAPDVSAYIPAPARPAQRLLSASGAGLPTRTAARWASRHAVNQDGNPPSPNTVRGDWPHPFADYAALVAECRRRGYDVQRCDDAGCICWELLAVGAANE